VVYFLEPSDIRWERYPAIVHDPFAKKRLKSQVLLGLTRNTVEAYGRGFQDFMVYCERGMIPLDRLRPIRLQQFYRELVEEGRLDRRAPLSPDSIVYHHRAIHKALNSALKQQLILTNPADTLLSYPGRPRRSTTRACASRSGYWSPAR